MYDEFNINRAWVDPSHVYPYNPIAESAATQELAQTAFLTQAVEQPGFLPQTQAEILRGIKAVVGPHARQIANLARQEEDLQQRETTAPTANLSRQYRQKLAANRKRQAGIARDITRKSAKVALKAVGSDVLRRKRIATRAAQTVAARAANTVNPAKQSAELKKVGEVAEELRKVEPAKQSAELKKVGEVAEELRKVEPAKETKQTSAAGAMPIWLRLMMRR